MEYSCTLFISKYCIFLAGFGLVEVSCPFRGQSCTVEAGRIWKNEDSPHWDGYFFPVKTLEGCFEYADLDTSQSTASTEKIEEEVKVKACTPSKQIPATLSSDGGLANTVSFPLKIYSHCDCRPP